jgi:hypothetical protein
MKIEVRQADILRQSGIELGKRDFMETPPPL